MAGTVAWGRRNPLAAWGVALSVGAYLISFFLPACRLSEVEGAMSGFQCFVLAPQMARDLPLTLTGLSGLHFAVGWLPNPLFWVGACLLPSGRRSRLVPAALVGLLALVGALVWQVLLWPFLLPGYYVWLASMALLASFAMARLVRLATVEVDTDA